MAARRLAISSLLCADDDASHPPPSAASPPQASPPHIPSQLHSVLGLSSPEEDSHDGRYDSVDHFDKAVRNESTVVGRDVVPLSLQPVQLRRHTPSPRTEHGVAYSSQDLHTGQQYLTYERDAGLTGIHRQTVHLNESYNLVDYHGRLQAESLPHHSSMRLSDSHQQQSYFPQGTLYPLARPSSSRSARSDSASNSLSYALPLPQPPHSHSPTQSPASVYDLPLPQRHPSHSPVLPARNVSTSPVNYYHSLALPRSPYTSSHQLHFSSTQPSVQISPMGASSLSTHFQPSQQSASLLGPQPPAALPHILNAPSPPARSVSGLGGLDALVQAATEERRRLSGEMASVGDFRSDDSPRLSRSPVTERASVRVEQAQQQPTSPPVSTPTRSLSELRSDVGRTNSNVPLYVGGISGPDGEPPKKKRRSSGAFDSGFSTAGPHTTACGVDTRALAPGNASVQYSSQYKRKVYTQEASSSTLTTNRRTPENPLPGIKHEDVGQDDRMTSGLVSPSQRNVTKATAQGDWPRSEENRNAHKVKIEENKEAKKEHQKRNKVVKKDKQQNARICQAKDGASRLEIKDVREQDPHEWLLEHYSTPSPPRPSHLPSLQEVKQPRYPSFTAQPPSHPSDINRSSNDIRVETKKLSKNVRSRTRTPTPLSILEQELEGTQVPAKVEATDPDVSLELNLASSTRYIEKDDQMDLDVDDELLSLLDDKPSPKHASRPKHGTLTFVHQDAHQRSNPSESNRATPDTHSALLPSALLSSSNMESMPPPAGHPKGSGQIGSAKAVNRSEGTSAAAGHKKKDNIQKPVPKAKPPPKPKAKSTAKPRPKATKVGAASAASPASGTLTPSVSTTSVKSKKASPLPCSITSGTKRSVSTAAGPSRSRSTSVMPGGSVGPDTDVKGPAGEAEGDGETREIQDDKLYCICKTSYDEDRVMIACDRCDEWYHTQCVNMPDLEVDLVDQFICPPCIESNPHLHLRTTYRRRCLFGLKHLNPSSPNACHKPARGAFSKYCSDKCGILYMQSRIDAWGGDKERLWESVKDANKREGVVVCVKERNRIVKIEGDMHVSPEQQQQPDLSLEMVKPSQTKVDRELARLDAQLEKLEQRREELKNEMEVVIWREKLVELATARAENLDECGWDQRLCFGDDEYAEFGAGVLESYEDAGQQEAKESNDMMQVDVEDGEWWCRGKRKCDRHAGWQKLRSAEVSFEKQTLEDALLRLTTQEREIRKHIEDVVDPKAQTSVPDVMGLPLQPLNGDVFANGLPKAKTNGEAVKKGKKRKN
ncbi:hypothetical protein AcW1_000576 [Taiwanofungus camphoratus]|nr:hypothetical protein AcW1_000576 [Antrodia cinnamomea]